MAVIEIAKIQVRRGIETQTGKPNSLDCGEFGWAIDSRKLYIGNGTTADGNLAGGNAITEIITEHTIQNIFAVGSYIYGQSFSEVGLTDAITGPNGNDDTIRTLQSKLDEYVSLADFGIAGSTATVLNTEFSVFRQVQLAIDQTFLNNTTDPRSRRVLNVPAGTYVITGTVYLPPYTTLVGAGQDKTIFKLASTSTTLMQTSLLSSGSYIEDLNLLTDNIPGIHLEGITFSYDSALPKDFTLPLLRVDCATDARIIDCKFDGDSSTSSFTYSGIDIRGRGQNAVSTKNLTIKGTSFSNIAAGITSNYDVEDINISDSKFVNLDQGIVFGNAIESSQYIGPIRANIHHNTFETIKFEGIYVGQTTDRQPTYHKSSFNSFVDVGSTGTTSIIHFGSAGNATSNDYFKRDFDRQELLDTDTSTYYRSVTGNAIVHSGIVNTGTVESTTLFGVPKILTRIPYSGSDQTIKLDYILSRVSAGKSRVGELSVVVALGTVQSIVDNYSFTGASNSGVTFNATLTNATNTISIFYTETELGGPIKFKYNILQ